MKQPAIRGVLPCKTCGAPHDAYTVRVDLAPQWAKGGGGHYYWPVDDPEGVLTRLVQRGALTREQILQALT